MRHLLELLTSISRARRRGSGRSDLITIVSGLPRSGTSMMMMMLEAGGVEVLSDGLRTPDADNPRGYYELERVKRLRDGDSAWLADAQGKAVKVISELLRWLPQEYAYRVIFIRRAIEEVLASQRSMLARRGTGGEQVDDERIAKLFRKHLETVDEWLRARPAIPALYVNYSDVLADPLSESRRVSEFLGGRLDVSQMAAAVELGLYRHRKDSRGLDQT